MALKTLLSFCTARPRLGVEAQPQVGVGASGAVCGLLGALVAVPEPGEPLERRGALVLACALAAVLSGVVEALDEVAHVAGFLAGACVARRPRAGLVAVLASGGAAAWQVAG